MCLSSLEKFTPAKRGYQLKKRVGNCYVSVQAGSDKLQPKDMWMDEIDYRASRQPDFVHMSLMSSSRYKVGWHVFHGLSDCRRHLGNLMRDHFYPLPFQVAAIVKVEIDCPGATGYQDGKEVTVAKRIKIIGEEAIK